MYGFHFFYNITIISTCIHASKYTFCSVYFVICLFTPSWFMEKEAAFKAGWNHQLLKCGGGEYSANHGKSWSSPWRRWVHVYMMDDRWGRADGGMRLWTSYWSFHMLNLLEKLSSCDLELGWTWVRYDSEVIFRSNLLCKEQPVRKPMSPVARPKGAWKILKDHDDRRFEYPTSLTREQWQQSAEKWQILRFHTISTSHPCSLPTSFA